ncbi:MAG: yobV [Symbiobacteriaceae bacterium]|nr:yobV [Symbiobacteriaceae bacterium]
MRVCRPLAAPLIFILGAKGARALKLDRLMAMLMILVNRRRVQASELADMFEVSVRTVYRDIDTINQAGIPVVTYQGAGGGIGIADGFTLDRNFLTGDELASMAVALRTVFAASQDQRAGTALEKIRGLVTGPEADRFRSRTESLTVDFTPWGHDAALQSNVALLRRCAEEDRCATFRYVSAQGDDSTRVVEPYTLVLKGQTWYLYALCRLRREFRLFKLARMRAVEATAERFERQAVDLAARPWEAEGSRPGQNVTLLLRFEPQMRHVAEEWFGGGILQRDPDGRCVARVTWREDEWVYGWILSFGPGVEVLEPAHVREQIRTMAAATAARYGTGPA